MTILVFKPAVRRQLSDLLCSALKPIPAKLKVTEKLRLFLFQRQCGKCPVGSHRINFDHCHVDHMRPWALGGGNEKTNLQLLCPEHNLEKGWSDMPDFMRTKGYLL